MRRILGIDPGSRYTGYGVIESDGHNSRHIASGRICIGDKPFCDRLGDIFKGVTEIISDYAPQEAAVEEVESAEADVSADPTTLAADVIADQLVVSPEERQRILEMTEVSKRVGLVTQSVASLLAQLSEAHAPS